MSADVRLVRPDDVGMDPRRFISFWWSWFSGFWTLSELALLDAPLKLLGQAGLAFLILATGLPQVQASLKLTSLDLKGWLLALGVPFVTIFWMELMKIVQHHHSGSAREGNGSVRL